MKVLVVQRLAGQVKIETTEPAEKKPLLLNPDLVPFRQIV